MSRTQHPLYLLLPWMVLLSSAIIQGASGFMTIHSSFAPRQHTSLQQYRHRSSVVLQGSSNIFTDILNFFDDFGKDDDKKPNSSNKAQSSSSEFSLNNDNLLDEDDDDLPAGEIRIATIPVQDIKPGGLRLFLMFYLMGLQNQPDPKTWMANQPTTEDYVIDFWYHDKSAVLTIALESNKISVTRVGSNPSTAYLMQESLVAQGLLDELQTMANDKEIEPENRLLILETDDAIEKARDLLAFG